MNDDVEISGVTQRISSSGSSLGAGFNLVPDYVRDLRRGLDVCRSIFRPAAADEEQPLLFYGLGFALSFLGALGADASNPKMFSSLAQVAGSVLFLCGHFSLKHALEDYYNRVEKIGLQLSGVMTVQLKNRAL